MVEPVFVSKCSTALEIVSPGRMPTGMRNGIK